RGIVAVAILAGIISGGSHRGLPGLGNKGFNQGGASSTQGVWGFLGLCLILPVTRIISQTLLANLAQGALFDLRMRLCRRILTAPLRHLETVGVHRLLAALTEDVVVIGGAFTTIPVICTHLTVLTACLVYMGWLSLTVLGLVLAFLMLGVLSF